MVAHPGTLEVGARPLLQETIKIENKDYPSGEMIVIFEKLDEQPSIIVRDPIKGIELNFTPEELRLVNTDLYWSAYYSIEEALNRLRWESNILLEQAPNQLKRITDGRWWGWFVRTDEQGTDTELATKTLMPVIRVYQKEEEFCTPFWGLGLTNLKDPVLVAGWNNAEEIQKLIDLMADEEALAALASLTYPDEMAALTSAKKIEKLSAPHHEE